MVCFVNVHSGCVYKSRLLLCKRDLFEPGITKADVWFVLFEAPVSIGILQNKQSRLFCSSFGLPVSIGLRHSLPSDLGAGAGAPPQLHLAWFQSSRICVSICFAEPHLMLLSGTRAYVVKPDSCDASFRALVFFIKQSTCFLVEDTAYINWQRKKRTM